MFEKEWRESGLLLQIKNLKEKVAAYESGERYEKLREEHRKELAAKDRRIRELEREAARSHAETVDVRNKWMQVNEDVLKETDRTIAKKERELEKTRDAMYRAERERDEALEELRTEKRHVRELECQVYELQGQLQQLNVKINKDYTNSSKPSSASPNHGKIHNSRKPTGRRPGGQPGHIHHGRKQLKPDRTVEIPVPREYGDAGRYTPTGYLIRKQLIRLLVATEVTEYVTPEFLDHLTGRRVHAGFPEGLKDEVNYDGSVKAAAYLLNNRYNVSIGNTCAFLREVSGGKINLSAGMVCHLAREFSEKTKEERDRIFLRMTASHSLHADFTFGRVNGKQAAVILCATPELALYQAREKKGHEGVKGSPVEIYHGTIISDHESTFHNYGDRHQECLVHVERYLRSGIENEPGLEWHKEMLEWIRSAIHYWNVWQERGEADEGIVAKLESQYDEIIRKAKKEYEYEIPSEYFRDGYNLYKRMAEDRDDYLLFLHDREVAPTNNLAERCARKVKRKLAEVMGFRSQDGLSFYCDGQTVMQTLVSEGGDLFEEVVNIFNRRREAKA